MQRKFPGPAILLTLVSVSACFLAGCSISGGGVPQQVATHLSVVAQNSAVAGAAVSVTVTALDASNNIVSTYSGTVGFASSDGQALLPPASTLPGGTGTFSVTLKTPGPQTVTATDTVTPAITGTSNSISVGPPAPTHFSVDAPSSSTAGVAVSVTVIALDASNNVVHNYSGTVHFTSTDAQASLPANSTLSNGTGDFLATLKTLGNQTITATDIATASITGTSGSISVGTAAPTHFFVTAPSKVSPGSSLSFGVTAVDAANNPAPTYSGTVHFTSTDSQATLPPNSSLTNGAGTFPATLNSPGSQTITATDTVTASVTGTSNAIQVAKLAITSPAPPNGTVGTPYGGVLPTCVIGGISFGFELAASGGNGKFSWSATSLPPGLQIQTMTVKGPPPCPPAGFVRTVITGTPTQAGTFKNVQVTVMDSASPPAVASASYTITINAAGSLAITSSAPPNGTVNQSYGGSQIVSGQQVAGFPLTATGGTGSYSWTWAPAPGSSLPPGLTISTFTFGGSTRCCTIITVINGTPTTTGTFHVIVTVADSASPPAQVSGNYTIAIAGSSTLAITSGPPPSGTAGKRYDTHCNQIPPCNQIIIGFPLTASGGVPPYSWSWAGQGSSPPPGLQINSSLLCINLSGPGICGLPTVAGSFQVVVTVGDSASAPNQAHANYTITINNPPAPIVNTSPSPSAGALNLPYDFIFTAADGLSPLTWSQTGPLSPGLTFSTDGKLTGTPTALGSFPITVVVQDSLNRTAPQQDFSIQIFSHGFKATGSMGTARTSHTATVLKNNKVLVAGGFNSDAGDLATAELFDPVNQTFSATGGMSTARPQHTPTLLKNGRVLVAGGMNLATAELYDPTGGTFTLTGSMSANRRAHAATLLNDGRVLLTGGIDDATGNALTTAELYDPNSGTFTLTGSMATARAAHTATLLSDGRVLVTGGSDSNLSPLATAEIFDPVKGTFTSVSSMNASRELHAAVLLKSGKVLVAGGFDAQNHEIATAEVFDPVPGTFTAAGNMETGRAAHTATLLNDGTVLVAGGIFENMSLASAELFNPTSGSFSPTGSMTTARSSHTASLLSDGTVLVAGGDDINFAALASAELYK